MKRIATLLTLVLATALNAFGQDFNIRVVNEMRMPISYAIITIEGAPRAITDIDAAASAPNISSKRTLSAIKLSNAK